MTGKGVVVCVISRIIVRIIMRVRIKGEDNEGHK